MDWIIIGLYGIALCFIFSYSLSQFHLLAIYWRKRKAFQKAQQASHALPEQWPMVTVQLPLFNEKYVVERLLDNIVALDYPKNCLEIQILDDSTDETTALLQKKIQSLQSTNIDIQLVRRPNRQGYKAGALKYGLEIAKGEFIAIFDADFLPSADFLKKTIPPLVANQKLGVAQTRWGHLNRNYSSLTKLQAFALDAHFTIEQTARNIGGHFINFNGTAGVWRKECILDAGNWEADTLTEDLDLSYRAQLKGWKFLFLEEVESPAELPASMEALKSQQFRWTKGGAETARKNLKRVLSAKDVPWGTKIHSTFHLLNSCIFLAVLTTALLSVPMLFVKDQHPELDLLFKVAGVFLLSLFTLGFHYATAYFRFRTFSWSKFGRFLMAFPMFMSMSMGLSLHNAIAVFEGLIGKKSPFVRTPKFNIMDKKDGWKDNTYLLKKLPPLTLAEGLLALFFLCGIGIGIYLDDYGLLPFHMMLFLGYGGIFVYTLKHAR